MSKPLTQQDNTSLGEGLSRTHRGPKKMFGS